MLALHQISKSFPGVQALQQVSLKFEKGTVHALCGENGAGKSTLMHILAGNIQPDNGRIILDENALTISDSRHAKQLGIGTVYQERSLADALTVAENIYPESQPLDRFGFISYRKLNQQARVLLDELQLATITPQTRVDKLSAAQKQMVEIARALAQSPRVLILDEPTASITHSETVTLFHIIRRLKQQGVVIIYISHRMTEIKEIADTVSILKDGISQGTFPVATISMDAIITKMVGRVLQKTEYVSHVEPAVALEVKGLTGAGFFNVSFSLHEGEILGIAGLEGSGRTELSLAIFGDYPYTSGEIIRGKQPLRLSHPADAISNGIAYLPNERKSQGLFMERSISDNVIATDLDKGLYDLRYNDGVAAGFIQRLQIRTPSVRQLVEQLSGGNQQKVVLAKWLNINPRILIVNEPTHGVDVGAKAAMYEQLKALTAEGKSVLLISGDLTELLLLSDRIAVMYNGELQGIRTHDEATEENITAMASGIQT